MKVSLISPPNQFLENPRATPRIGLLYLGTILQNSGHYVKICHLNSLQELPALLESEFDFIGISASTREYLDALQILNYFKREQPNITIALGGAHATALPKECLRNGFDMVVSGEADNLITHLVELHSVRSTEVATHYTQPQVFYCEYVEDINAIPFPDRTLLKEEWHPFMGIKKHISKVTPMLLSRGCPYHCSFCGPHFQYRRRSTENIQAELQILARQGYEGVIILDDIPFLMQKHVEDFCSIIRPLGLSFRCNFRADSLTVEIAQMLKAANCCRVQIGVESVTHSIFSAMNKQMDIDSAGCAISMCRDAGIQTKAMFIWGLPGDSHASADAIIQWVQKFNPDSIQVSMFVPLPASSLWHDYHQKVSDYLALSFFGNKNIDVTPLRGGSNGVTSGVGNDSLSPEELWALRERILYECSKITYVDLGVTAGRKMGLAQ
jgi:radical SAM superfamily enzyme YgiQ (UPF0313 family)